MNCLGGGSGVGLFSLVPERDGSRSFGTFSGDPFARSGVALLFGDSVTAGRGVAPTLLMAEADVVGLLDIAELFMTSCGCCCGCTRL